MLVWASGLGVVAELGSGERRLVVVWAPELGVCAELGSGKRGLAVVWAPGLGLTWWVVGGDRRR